MRTPVDPQRLRRRRVTAGLSQSALADAIGVSKQLVSAVSLGKANFSPEKLAEILGCDLTDLPPEDLTTVAEILGCDVADLLPQGDAEPTALDRRPA